VVIIWIWVIFRGLGKLDSRFRGNDGVGGGNDGVGVKSLSGLVNFWLKPIFGLLIYSPDCCLQQFIEGDFLKISNDEFF